MKKGLLLQKMPSTFDQANRFLQSGRLEQFRIIRGMMGGKPQFISRCFAEYFMVKRFTDNLTACEDLISDTLLISQVQSDKDTKFMAPF